MFQLIRSNRKISRKETIEQIHNEFDNAENRLLEEAKSIIAQNQEIDTRSELAHSLGFVNTPVVIKTLEKIKLTVGFKELANTISYYKQEYPFQKFLTEDELKRICKKYNLIYAPISFYTKDVPEKNLNEINNSKKLWARDLPDDIKKCKITPENWLIGGGTFLGINQRVFWKMPKYIDGHYISPITVDSELQQKLNTNITYLVKKIQNITINRQGLFIAAPKSHFKGLKSLNHHNDFGYAHFTIQEIKDPIVFRYCKKGIQVLSKWGLEASDEIVVNQKMN